MDNYGLCECGCGEITRIAPRSCKIKGWIKGEHLRFAGPGHNAKITNHPHRDITDRDWVEEDRGYRTICRIWINTLGAKGYALVMINCK
jgi:hypothetical protein